MSSKTSIYAELTKKIKVKRNGDNDQEHLAKIAKAADKLPDDAWEEFSTEAQEWLNDAVEAVRDGEEIAAPDGFEGGDETSDEAEGEEKTSKSSKKAAKAGKSADKKADKKAAKKVAEEKSSKPAKKAEKADDEKKGRGRPSKSDFDPSAKITLLVKENPYREGGKPHERFAVYKNGMTVKTALEKGVGPNLKRSVEAGYISVK